MQMAAAQDMPPQASSERQRYATGFANQDATQVANAGLEAQAVRAETGEAPASLQEQPVRQQPVRPSQALPDEAALTQSPPARGLPQVKRFELPVNELAQVAQGSGLQWVNSDAEKIAAVQAAIAAETKPIHLPRERASAAVVQDGPLVLVETKRDLREMKLPFEQPGTPLQ